MAMRQIDLDLFVNSASKGFNDGAKVPSPFAAFVDSFFKGMDASQDYQTQALQNQQREFEISQQPYKEQVNQAAAIKAQADAEVITENEDLYKSAQIAGLEAEKAKRDQAALLQKQETELIELSQSDDPAAKGQALIDGRFESLYAMKGEEFKKRFTEVLYTGADDASVQTYDEILRAERNKEWNLEAREIAVKNKSRDMGAVIADGDLGRIKDAIGGNVSFAQMIDQGSIVDVQINGMGQIVTPEEIRKGGFKATDLTPRKVFRYPGREDIDIGGINSESSTKFETAKATYKTIYQLDQDMNGIGDMDKMRRNRKDAEAKAKAEASLQYEKNQAQLTSDAEKFFMGAQIDPKMSEMVRPAAQVPSLRDRLTQDRSVQAPAPASAVPTPGPDIVPRDFTVKITPEAAAESAATAEARTGPATPPGVKIPSRAATPTPTRTPEAVTPPGVRAQPVTAPGWSVTPGTATPQAVRATVAQTPAPSIINQAPSQNQQQLQLKQQMIKSKAREKVNRYQATNSPVPSQPAPVDQARQVTSSSFVPSSFKMNVGFQPNADGIRRVAQLPFVENFSALTKAVLVQESGGDPDAISPTGVKGLGQVTEATQKDVQKSARMSIDFTSPEGQVLGASIYLEKLLNTPTFENNPMLALTGYNAGPGVVAEAVRLAGSTDWDIVKNYIEPAVLSFSTYFKRQKVDPKTKAAEARTYAEKVVANFPSFVSTRADMAMADKLKQQNVLSYT